MPERSLIVTLFLLLLSCSTYYKKPSSDPCIEAIRLRKLAERNTTDQRGVLEAKAAAMQSICDGKRQRDAETFKEAQRRAIENQ